jgi:hypothetical protein
MLEYCYLAQISSKKNSKLKLILKHIAVKGSWLQETRWVNMFTVVRYSLGPWRSMSIFILNMLFAIEKRISVSTLSSKMNR